MPLYPGVPYEYTSTASGLVFAAGACPLDAEGHTVAPGNLEAQARQAVDNLLEALAEAGAAPEDLLKTTIYVVSDVRSDLVRAWTVVSERIGRAPSTLLGVSCLGYPDQLVEIEAIARAKPLTPSGRAAGASALLRHSR
jgi:enamine deaminase RidA (YjgF/YER057c/UK114 family)